MDDIERQQDGLDRANALAEAAGRRRQLLEQEVNLLRGKPSVIPSERAKQEEALKSVHTKQVESQRRYEKEVSSFQTPQQVEQAMRQEFGRTEPRKIDLVETDVLQKLKERRNRLPAIVGPRSRRLRLSVMKSIRKNRRHWTRNTTAQGAATKVHRSPKI